MKGGRRLDRRLWETKAKGTNKPSPQLFKSCAFNTNVSTVDEGDSVGSNQASPHSLPSVMAAAAPPRGCESENVVSDTSKDWRTESLPRSALVVEVCKQQQKGWS